MTGILSGPLTQAVGWALLHLLWQGVLVAAILAASLALLNKRSANARYLASCGALILIVALSLITAYRAYDPIRAYNDGAPIAPAATFAASDALVFHPSTGDITTYATSHMPQIVLVWLAGVVFLSSRLILGWLAALRLAGRHAHPAEDQWQRAMIAIADALAIRRTIRLLESAAVEVPTVVGWLRPVVLLPVAVISGMAPEQIEMILAHELAHIRRHDFIVNLLQSSVETLFFYQPAVWWISRRIRVEREHCCDDLAVAISGDPLRYARALTRFEELRIDAAQTVLAASGGSLVARVRRLVGVSGESATWSSRWTAGAALLTLVMALLVGPTLPAFAKHEQQPTPAPAPAPAPTPTPKAALVPAPVIAPAPAPKAKPSCRSEIEVRESADLGDEINDAIRDALADQNGMVDAVVDASLAPMAAAITEAVAPVVATAPEAAMRALRTANVRVWPRMAHARAQSHRIADEKHLTVDDLITLRTFGVTPEYIEQMRAASLGDLSLNDIIALRVQGITPDFIRGLRAAGVDVRSAENAIALRVQGVTPEYIQGMRAAGYDKLSTGDLIAMRVQGVSPKFVQEMASAGYRNLTPKDLIELRVQGVNGEFVKSLAEAGYTNLSVRDLVRLAASGVNARFIRDLAKYRSKQ